MQTIHAKKWFTRHANNINKICTQDMQKTGSQDMQNNVDKTCMQDRQKKWSQYMQTRDLTHLKTNVFLGVLPTFWVSCEHFCLSCRCRFRNRSLVDRVSCRQSVLSACLVHRSCMTREVIVDKTCTQDRGCLVCISCQQHGFADDARPGVSRGVFLKNHPIRIRDR